MYYFSEQDALSLETLLNSYDFAANGRADGPQHWPGSNSSDPRLQALNELGLLISRSPGMRGLRTYRLQCPPLYPAVASDSEELKLLQGAREGQRRVFVMPPELFARYARQLALLQGPEYSVERVVSDLAHIGGSRPYDFRVWPQPGAEPTPVTPEPADERELLRDRVSRISAAVKVLQTELPQLFAAVENQDLSDDPRLPEANTALDNLYLLSRKFSHKDF